ncbi:MAG: metalloregulator ArsR/SmtB family transcription factor [Candidatus Muirbacterium halophilum]|nr:metalloregulator ArsR/SmtB family transcription factor [Candidatus Muirbacterium halophilum]MCK9474538.1 metalloregulator ArsR/SmtB family transcription factor [Candidatus Muirbacterium halophilum]
MRKIAETAKALAHPTRLSILQELLKGEPTCVSKIEEILQKKQANVSQHLSILKNAGIIDYQEKGKLRCYFLTDMDSVDNILKSLKILSSK